MFRSKIVAIWFIAFATVSSAQSNDAYLAAEIRAKDELLLNAVHRGDRKLWADVTTSDFMYIEDGEILRRDALLKELEEDGSAPLIIKTFELHRIGDTAMVLHLDDVPPGRPRNTKNTHLLMSETWQRINGQWKLRLVDIDRLRIDPPAIALPHVQIDELVGTYKAGENTYKIRRDGDRILATRGSAPDIEWKVETLDVLFEPGDARSRKLFQRTPDGKVTGFIDRDESSDLVWVRQ